MEPFPAAVAATNDRQRQIISVLGDAVAVSDGPDRSKCVCGAAVLEGGGRGGLGHDTTRQGRAILSRIAVARRGRWGTRLALRTRTGGRGRTPMVHTLERLSPARKGGSGDWRGSRRRNVDVTTPPNAVRRVQSLSVVSLSTLPKLKSSSLRLRLNGYAVHKSCRDA